MSSAKKKKQSEKLIQLNAQSDQLGIKKVEMHEQSLAVTGKPKVRQYFTEHKELINLPNLVDHQNKSFQWFVDEGFGELLAEISPIDDYTGTKLIIRFKDYRFEKPKISEAEARENNVSYDAPLKALSNWPTKSPAKLKSRKFTWVITHGWRVAVLLLLMAQSV